MGETKDGAMGMNTSAAAQPPDEGANFGLHTDHGKPGESAQESQPPDEGANFGLHTDHGKG